MLRPGVFCPGKGRCRGASGWMCRAGLGGQSAIAAAAHLPAPVRSRITARLPLEVNESRPSRRSLLCDFRSHSWYNRAHARLGTAHRHRRPGRWLAKSCVANATSVSKAAWLGQPSPTPAARARSCPRACSLLGRGGRCELDASPPMGLEGVALHCPRFTPARFFWLLAQCPTELPIAPIVR